MNDARVAARTEAENEYRRLLYVAMTRAAERLVVCGVESRKRPEGCWYDLVLQSLQNEPGISEHDASGLKIWRYHKVQPSSLPEQVAEPGPPVPGRPAWLTRPMAEERQVQVLTPSRGMEAPDQRVTATITSKMARKRGVLTHRLLQSLPDTRSEDRTKAMEDFLARQGELDRAACSVLGEQVMRVLNDRRFAELFVPDSRAEVPIVGWIEAGGKRTRVSGQVDRLVVTKEAVLIADFKTGRPATKRLEAYIRQLALYRAVLEKLYPDKLVRAALIWTEVPDLMELSGAMLDDALANITPA
jgi:ATP-dependent helicase/nuclease subunit A